MIISGAQQHRYVESWYWYVSRTDIFPSLQGELWHNFFETLINAQSRGAPPNLAALRREFEDYFAQNDSQRAAVRVCLLKQGLLLDQFLD